MILPSRLSSLQLVQMTWLFSEQNASVHARACIANSGVVKTHINIWEQDCNVYYYYIMIFATVHYCCFVSGLVPLHRGSMFSLI